MRILTVGVGFAAEPVVDEGDIEGDVEEESIYLTIAKLSTVALPAR